MKTDTKTAYTPGPWGIDSDGDIRSQHTVNNGYASEAIANLPAALYRAERAGERTANAHLIAAAPELLAALKASREWLDTVGDRKILTQVRAAIAKAEVF